MQAILGIAIECAALFFHRIGHGCHLCNGATSKFGVAMNSAAWNNADVDAIREASLGQSFSVRYQGKECGNLLISRWPCWPVRRIVISLAWVAGVVWFWLHFVPLSSIVMSASDDRMSCHGAMASGKLLFTGYLNPKDSSQLFVGPARSVDPQTGRDDWRRFDENDRILDVITGAESLAIIDHDHHLSILDCETGQILPSWSMQSVSATAARLSHNASLVAVNDSGRLAISDVETGEQLWSCAVSDPHCEFEFVSSNLLWILSASADRIEEIRDAKTGQMRHPQAMIDWYSKEHVSPDGRLLVSSSTTDYDDTARMFDLETGDVAWTFPLWVSPSHVHFSSDGSEVLCAASQAGKISIARWRAADGRVLLEAPQGASSSEAALSPDGRFAVGVEPVSVTWFERARYRLSQWSGLNWGSQSLRLMTRLAVMDATVGLRHGFVDCEGVCRFNVSNEGLAVWRWGEMARFAAFPPRRNWLWVFAWGLAPIAVFEVFLSLWRCRAGGPGDSAQSGD